MVDYSKWKDIEVSDDEDDTHPNIDTPSLFKWRHEARMERMEEHKRERIKIDSQYKETIQKQKAVKEKMKSCDSTNMKILKEELESLEAEEKKLSKIKSEVDIKEKKMPWNVDTICKEGFSKTVLNHPEKPIESALTEEEKEKRMKIFVQKHEHDIKSYGMMRKFDDSKRFLQENLDLVSEDTANYLVIWCINLAMQEKFDLMEHVAHQCICMQFILELAKQLNVNPRSCVSSFFTRIQLADREYRVAFDDELTAFIDRIKKRAEAKVEEAMKEAEEEARQERLGPGGLDPIEVMESLPKSLQKCFESQDIELLKKTISEMDEEEAKYHMKRCVDSGLWVTDAQKSEEKTSEDGPEATAKDEA